MLNHFKRSYPEYQFRPLTTALLPACAEALERWCGERQNNCTNFPTLLQESLAIRCMFEHWSRLAPAFFCRARCRPLLSRRF